MRIAADLQKCQGYVSCIMAAPEVFDIDDEGKVVVLVTEPTEEQRPTAEAAVRKCPVRALTLIDV